MKTQGFALVLLTVLVIVVCTVETIVKNCYILLRLIMSTFFVRTCGVSETGLVIRYECEDTGIDHVVPMVNPIELMRKGYTSHHKQLEESAKIPEFLQVTPELTEQRKRYLDLHYTRQHLLAFCHGRIELKGKSKMRKNDVIGKVLGYLEYNMIPYRCGWGSLLQALDSVD